MTIQTLFDRMMAYDNQLDLISGGDDVTRGLTLVNLVQDWWEEVAASVASLCQTAEDSILTVANQVYTTWPSDLRRIDALWLLDANGKQVREIEPIDADGDFQPGWAWPFPMLSGSSSSGAPQGFYTQGQGGLIYWDPTPNAVYTVRGYGLFAKDDYTAAANTFAYPDGVALVIVPEVVKIFRIGLERLTVDQKEESKQNLRMVIASLSHQVHTGPSGRVYSGFHTT